MFVLAQVGNTDEYMRAQSLSDDKLFHLNIYMTIIIHWLFIKTTLAPLDNKITWIEPDGFPHYMSEWVLLCNHGNIATEGNP